MSSILHFIRMTYRIQLWLLAGLCLGNALQAAHPAFMAYPIQPTASARVIEVTPEPTRYLTDLVYLEGGLDQGLRTGMECLVEHDGKTIARLVLVAVHLHHCAALILEINDEHLLPGDLAKAKIISPAS